MLMMVMIAIMRMLEMMKMMIKMMIIAMIMMRRGMALERWAECMRLILKGSNAKLGLQDVDWG